MWRHKSNSQENEAPLERAFYSKKADQRSIRVNHQQTPFLLRTIPVANPFGEKTKHPKKKPFLSSAVVIALFTTITRLNRYLIDLSFAPARPCHDNQELIHQEDAIPFMVNKHTSTPHFPHVGNSTCSCRRRCGGISFCSWSWRFLQKRFSKAPKSVHGETSLNRGDNTYAPYRFLLIPH